MGGRHRTKGNKEEKKKELRKQLEQEQNHRNGDHMESYRQGGGRRRMWGKGTRMRCLIGRHKVDMVR